MVTNSEGNKMRLILIATLLVGCATTKKAAREWDQKNLNFKPEGMSGVLFRTEGEKKCTVVAFHGLGDVVTYPKRARYNSETVVDRVNESGCSHVLAIDYGMAFMLKPFGTGLESVAEYVRELQAVIAKEKLPTELYAVGVSMGGSNALTVAMLHPDLFKKIIVLNPMILKEWNDKFDINDKENPALMPGQHFSKDEWARSNLFVITRPITSKIWMTAARRDQFRLFEPAKAWAEYAKGLGLDIEFDEADTDHMNPSDSWKF